LFWGERVGLDQPEGCPASGGTVRVAWQRRIALTLGLALALFQLCPAMAQERIAPFPGQPVPGRNVPPPAPPPPPQFEFSIPAPQRGPVPRAVDIIEFDVSDIKVVGATVFPQDAFKPITAAIIGKRVKLSAIIDVADQIEAMYRQHGYVLTRAFVPPQTVANGVFRIDVVEGFVKAAGVSGGDEYARDRVEHYIAPITLDKPAKLESMERGLLLANSLPGVAASGLLRPSPTVQGASDLLVTLTQKPWQATVYSDNRGGATTGRVTLGAQLVANSLVYVPGQLMFDASGTPDFSTRRLFQARYARPVGYEGLIFSASGVLAHGAPVTADSVSNSYSLAARLSYPLMLSRQLSVTVEGGLTVQESIVTPAGNVATFGPPDTPEIDDKWRTADVAITAQTRGLIANSTTGATFGITQGLPYLGASSTRPFSALTGPEAEGSSLGFTKFTLVADHDQPISGPVSANFHMLGQYTRERLVIGEQTSFGGSGIGRGYDPAALAADIGIGLASELRYDTHFPEYHVDTAQFYVFFDAAKVRPLHDESVNLRVGEANHRSIMSIGFGVRAALLQMVTGGIEFAQELEGVPNNNDGKVGSRILFNAAVRF
jgi:hemolysin activation/secretion protein